MSARDEPAVRPRPFPLDVPAVVRNRAVAAGSAARLDELPSLVAGLERDWSIGVGQPFPDSTEALVAEATTDDGTPAVLKLLIPSSGDAAANEITVLRLTEGEACARLLRDDVARSALLLERLGRSLHELALPIGRRLEILVSTAARVWRPAPDCGLPTGADKARWLTEFVTQAGEGFKLVDPDGLLAEAEYDMGILMREDPLELLDGDPRGRAALLAARTGLCAEAIWEWGVVERVSTGLLCTKVDLQPAGREMLAVADHVAG